MVLSHRTCLTCDLKVFLSEECHTVKPFAMGKIWHKRPSHISRWKMWCLATGGSCQTSSNYAEQQQCAAEWEGTGFICWKWLEINIKQINMNVSSHITWSSGHHKPKKFSKYEKGNNFVSDGCLNQLSFHPDFKIKSWCFRSLSGSLKSSTALK